VAKSNKFLIPERPIDSEAYERLYEFNSGADDMYEAHDDVREIRFRPGLTEEAVYRMLPSAKGFEYGGYLTKSRIRFHKCEPVRAVYQRSKPCTFHSHPTKYAQADIPSASDVYHFLDGRNLRTIIVGASRLIVWDKTMATLETVKKLGTWAKIHLVTETRRLLNESPNNFMEEYMKVALKHLGLNWPKKHRIWETHWEGMVRDILKIEVRVFSRSPE